jgi:hypothetical protein
MLELLVVGLIVCAAAFFAARWLRRSTQGRNCHEICGIDARSCPLSSEYVPTEAGARLPKACCGIQVSEQRGRTVARPGPGGAV